MYNGISLKTMLFFSEGRKDDLMSSDVNADAFVVYLRSTSCKGCGINVRRKSLHINFFNHHLYDHQRIEVVT